jgi:hypothetical protein
MWNFGAAMRPPFVSMARIAWSMSATEIVHSGAVYGDGNQPILELL